MKPCYFIYNERYIVKGTILQKVFRLVPNEYSNKYYGYIRYEEEFINKMVYRYYYIIKVDSICKLISINGGTETIKDVINHPITIIKPVEKVYDNIDCLMINNQKAAYQPIDKGWVKEILNESNLPSKGYVLDYNLNIISAHLSTKIIEFPSIQVNTAKPFTYEYNYESEPYYSDETYKVTAKYVGDDKRYYDFKDLFISIDDAIEEKKKHFEVIDSLEFKEAIYNDFNNINFEEIKYTILKRLNGQNFNNK